MNKSKENPIERIVRTLTQDHRQHLKALATGEIKRGLPPALLTLRRLIYIDETGDQALTDLGSQVELHLRPRDDSSGVPPH